MQTTAQPGFVTGPCVQNQCYSGAICFQGGCYPDPGGSGNGSNQTSQDPTDTGGTGGQSSTTENVTTVPATTGDPPDTTTGVDTSATSITSVGTTTITTDPPDPSTSFPNTSDDSRGFITTDTDGEFCGGFQCAPDEMCVLLDDTPTCVKGCDPLTQVPCVPGEVCVPYQTADNFTCLEDASGNTGAVGDACGYANDCDPGNICLLGDSVAGCDGPSCCSAFCDLDLPDPCAQYGMQCVQWFEQGMAPPGHEDLGACVL